MGIALHNFPGYPLHTLLIKNGIFTAAVSSLIIRLRGRTSHASEPEHGINPSLAVAELLQASDKYNHNHPESPEFSLVTPVHVRIGARAYGVSAGDAEVHVTLRSWDSARLEQLRLRIQTLAEDISARHHLQLSLESLQTFHANENDAQVANRVRQAAVNTGTEVIEQSAPFKGGEDFGLFTSRFPCCMFGLGAGENTAALHNPDYDFPDALIETGVRVFADLVQTTLG